MKTVVLILLSSYIPIILYPQKKALPISVNDSWPQISDWKLTANGKYAAYNIEDTLQICSTDNKFRKKIYDTRNFQFLDDDYYAYLTNKHQLKVGKFSDSIMLSIKDISSYKLIKINTQPWIIYLKMDTANLILQSLNESNKYEYDHVETFLTNQDQTALLIKTKSKIGENKYSRGLTWISILNKESYTIIKNCQSDLRNYCFDKSGSRLAFVISKTISGQTINEIFYFSPGMASGRLLLNDKTPGIDSGFTVENGAMAFSSDGSQLFFSLQKKRNKEIADSVKAQMKVGVDIWDYKSSYLQSQQLNGYDGLVKKDIMAVYNINENLVIQLQKDEDASWCSFISQGAPDEYRLIETGYNINESYRNDPSNLYLVSTKTGERKRITNGVTVFEPRFSLSGKYVIYFDRNNRNYFTYDIGNNKTINITNKIPYPVYDYKDDRPMKPFPLNMSAIVGWLENDSAILINDEYDIWKIDPKGLKKPINITRGYGRENKTTLRYFQGNGNPLNYDPLKISLDDDLKFIAFDHNNKYNGFFKIKLTDKSKPMKLYMGPYIFHYPFNSYELRTVEPLKAKNNDVFLVQKMSPSKCLNIFSTSDFKSFVQLSDLKPEKEYNWYNTELIRWKAFDGKTYEGILYKPENFDFHKKYPIIFTFYERNSDYLFNFIYPRSSRGELNIPYYVSNGYLVFIPDIHYLIGHPAKSIYNSVISAAQYLFSKPWIDKTKAGLEGVSFGGYEVNVLITKSNLFAAAAETAGAVNFTSGYCELDGKGGSLQYLYEAGQNRIGKTIWQKPYAYIENSPFFYADKVSTPLLIMHNKLDGAVPWDQAVEWFTALRRLGKKVWMLQYDNETHGVSGEFAKIDYSIRQAQFFDHFLKNMPPPKWMIKGVQPSSKWLDSGLELYETNAKGLKLNQSFYK